MTRFLRIGIVALAVAIAAPPLAHAQAWRGMGRMAGKVTDEQGKPLEGVLVKAELPGAGATQATTNKKGEWALGGIARGAWNLDFSKPGYETTRIAVSIEELSRIPPVETKLKPTPVDPNEVVKGELIKAAELLGEKKYAEARAIYEGILAKYPQAAQVEPLLARTYYAEKQYDKAIEHLRLAVQKDPSSIENKLLLGNILIEQGHAEEGRQVLASVDDAAVKDPTTFVNVGIGLLNQNKPDEALAYFEKAIARFPQSGDAYYYRALVRLRKEDRDGAKADLTKFLELAPNAPEAPAARKALEQLKG
ncbi:MAG TPA: tetratricopeptide repeat protein [Vicinamibacterales bacterium]|jgi:tetratricopeptide (TPR) repeat protein